MQAVISLLGMCVLLGIAVLASNNRKAINIRTVTAAFGLQVGIAAFVLYTKGGAQILDKVSQGISSVIGFGQKGMDFLFGALVSDEMFKVFGGGGFIFALRVLPVIIFFSSLVAVLYHIGVMQIIIKVLGGGVQKLLGTSRTESMSATANIFVGQTEAPLVVRPYIAKMTESELFAVMCGGLASVAGSVLAGYASMGVKIEYLVAASFMAAPGGLLFAKLIVPETQKTRDNEVIEDNQDDKPVNVIDAAAQGASSGVQLAINVGGMLLAFVALIALLNGMLGGIGGLFGMPELTMQLILGKIFAPLAFLLGVPWNEAAVAGGFIGEKIIANEFVAYAHFADYLKDAVLIDSVAMSAHTKAIISFALCGFANLASVAILLGGLGAMAPNRRPDIARLGMRSVLAGTLSNLMSATIAGFFLSLSSM